MRMKLLDLTLWYNQKELTADFAQLCRAGSCCIGLPGQQLEWVYDAVDRLLCLDASDLPRCRLQFMEREVNCTLSAESGELRLVTEEMALHGREQVQEYLKQMGLLAGLNAHLLRLDRAKRILSGEEDCIPSEKLQGFLQRLKDCEQLPVLRRGQLLRIADGENPLGVRFVAEAQARQKKKLFIAAERHFEQLTACHYRLKPAETGAEIWDMYAGTVSGYAAQSPEVRLYAAVSIALAEQELQSGGRAFPYILQPDAFSDTGEQAFLAVRSYFYRLEKSGGAGV